MNESNKKILQTAQQRQCDIRLQNDTAALEAARSNRLNIDVKRFGERVKVIHILFPHVRTAFFNQTHQKVEIQKAVVQARILPNAHNAPPYPLGAPVTSIGFPNLARNTVPWLGGLLWEDGRKGLDRNQDRLSEFFKELLEASIKPVGTDGFGFPCLWREGEWNRKRDLLFVVQQIHRLLTDPGDYSPSDSMNPQAALYWATHKDQLPLEPPIPEIYGKSEKPVNREEERQYQGFNLIELEQ
jgi:hypothetical protein